MRYAPSLDGGPLRSCLRRSHAVQDEIRQWSLALLVSLSVGTMAAAVAAPPQRSPQRPTHKTAPTKTALRAVFRMDPSVDALLAPVNVFGAEYRFLVDTGCSYTGLDESFRKTLGAPSSTRTLLASDGKMRVDVFKAPRITIRGRRLEGISEVTCLDLRKLREVTGYAIYGVLGMDILAQCILRIDIDRGELSFLDAVPDAAGEPMPLLLSARDGPTILLRVSGAGTIPFAIDTGKGGDVSLGAEKRVFDRLISVGEARPLGVANFATLRGDGRRSVAMVRTVELGPYQHNNLVISAGTANAVGMRYLLRYRVTLDFPQCMIYLEPSARHNEPNRYDLSGLHLTRPGGRTVIERIDEDSPAAQSGIQAPDTIEQINGRPSASLTMFEIREMLCTPGEHTLRIQRDGRRFQLTLRLEQPPDPWAQPGGTGQNPP